MSQRQRFPRFLPQWIRERIEVNTFKLNRFMIKAAEETPAGVAVLDAGAGDGRFTSHFRHTRYIGVDLAVGDITWDYSALDTIANLTHLPFTDNTFAVVLCTQVLEHLAEPWIVLPELARVLKPGGRIYISAPQSWHQHQKPHDYYRYTSFGLRHLLQISGLIPQSIESMGGYFWFLSFQLQNLNYWVFSQRPGGRNWWTWPLRAFFGFVFQLVFPLLLFYLDPLDPIHDETFGYLCVASKPSAATPL